MEWLNYHHLLYFWTVAREGTVARASKHLGLAQPTISGQLRTLENALNEKLFVRSGRNLVLTEMGQTVYRYADEIFSLGRELQETLKGRPASRPVRLVVGIAEFVPRLVVYRLLQPALAMREPDFGPDPSLFCENLVARSLRDDFSGPGEMQQVRFREFDIARTRSRFKSAAIEHRKLPTAVADQPFRLQASRRLGYSRAPYAQHVSEEFMRQSVRVAMGPVLRHQQPACQPRIEEMVPVARGGLRKL